MDEMFFPDEITIWHEWHRHPRTKGYLQKIQVGASHIVLYKCSLFSLQSKSHLNSLWLFIKLINFLHLVSLYKPHLGLLTPFPQYPWWHQESQVESCSPHLRQLSYWAVIYKSLSPWGPCSRQLICKPLSSWCPCFRQLICEHLSPQCSHHQSYSEMDPSGLIVNLVQAALTTSPLQVTLKLTQR